MKLSVVLLRLLKMIQDDCNKHNCSHCKFNKNIYTHEPCLLGYPRKWKLDELTDDRLQQIPELAFEFDHWDLYDFFEQEDEEK